MTQHRATSPRLSIAARRNDLRGVVKHVLGGRSLTMPQLLDEIYRCRQERVDMSELAPAIKPLLESGEILVFTGPALLGRETAEQKHYALRDAPAAFLPTAAPTR